MTKLEKVLTGAKYCIKYLQTGECKYAFNPCPYVKQCQAGQHDALMQDMLLLISEKETTRAVYKKEPGTQGPWADYWYECEKCGKEISANDSFCRNCGRMVK